MNPIFVFLVLLGAALLWLILAFAFRAIGSIAIRMAKRAEKAMSDEPTKPEMFVRGFKSSFGNSEKSKGDKNSNE